MTCVCGVTIQGEEYYRLEGGICVAFFEVARDFTDRLEVTPVCDDCFDRLRSRFACTISTTPGPGNARTWRANMYPLADLMSGLPMPKGGHRR